MALQSDGSIIATTNHLGAPQSALVRLGADGFVDDRFGSDGTVQLPVAQALGEPVIQADGKIVVVGHHPASGNDGQPYRLLVVRFEPDGDLDRTFGTDGVAEPALGVNFNPAAAIQQRDGRLVIAGGPITYDMDAFVLIRLNRDGSPDQSFGDGGRVMTSNGQDRGFARGIVERAAGGLLVGGVSGREVTGPLTRYHDDAWVLRQYTANGAVDTGFGSRGETRVELDGFATSYFGPLLPTRGAFVGFASSSLSSVTTILPTHISLGRFDRNGIVDRDFGKDGFVHTKVVAEQTGRPSFSQLGDAAIQPDGKILVGGGYLEDESVDIGPPPSGWAVVRFLPDGSLDTGFGRGGFATSVRGVFQRVSDIAVQPSGRIVVGGTSTDCGRPIATLVGYLPDEGTDAGPAMRACAGTVDIESDGDLPIPIQCPFVEDACSGELAVEIPSLDLPVGKARFKLGGGRRRIAPVRAKGRALKILRKRGTRRAVATFTARDRERHRRVTRRPIKVRSNG